MAEIQLALNADEKDLLAKLLERELTQRRSSDQRCGVGTRLRIERGWR
jgi:hypothetical protein